jgi:hypothetical protein
MVTVLSLICRFSNGIQDFGADCQMTLRMMEEELKIGRETTGKILVEDLC